MSEPELRIEPQKPYVLREFVRTLGNSMPTEFLLDGYVILNLTEGDVREIAEAVRAAINAPWAAPGAFVKLSDKLEAQLRFLGDPIEPGDIVELTKDFNYILNYDPEFHRIPRVGDPAAVLKKGTLKEVLKVTAGTNGKRAEVGRPGGGWRIPISTDYLKLYRRGE